jgi:tryptophanase
LGRDPDTKENLKADKEFLRLTIPRRTYTFEHLHYVAESMIKVYERRKTIKGLEFTYESPILRHFTAKFKPTE